MPALLEIVNEYEIRDFARGRLSPERVSAVRKTIQTDNAAEAVFRDEFRKEAKRKEDAVEMNEQIQPEKRNGKRKESSLLTVQILTGSLMFAASIGIVTFAALSIGV